MTQSEVNNLFDDAMEALDLALTADEESARWYWRDARKAWYLYEKARLDLLQNMAQTCQHES